MQIVGFIDNAHYNHYMNLMAGNLDRDFLKMFGKLDLKIPGEKDTKLCLKKSLHYSGELLIIINQ